MTAALEISELTAGYGGLPVVRDLSLTVSGGEVVALLGANGAGKTTTLLSAAGVLAPSAGRIELLGHDIGGRRPEQIARDGLLLVPADRGVFHGLSVRDNLRLGLRRSRARGPLGFRPRLNGPRPSHPADGFDGVLELFPALRPLLGRRCAVLSGGEQQMLALAKALLAQPKVLLIDELSLGLAPVIVERLLPVIRRIASEHGMGVLLVEQHTPMALSVADRVYVMRRGTVALEGPASELRERRDLLEASYLGDHLVSSSNGGGRG